MAVLDGVPGIEVTIQVNGQDVVEYDDPDASELDAPCPTLSKYIECIDGTEFVIQYKVTNYYKWGYKNHCLHFRPWADGCRLSGKVFLETDLAKGSMHTKGVHEFDARTNQHYLRKCKFSTISTGMLKTLFSISIYLL